MDADAMDLPSRADDVLSRAAAWLGEGRQIALATVVSTWGSAPRPAGSQLVIDRAGNFEGSVSGGCVEGAVIVEAIEVIAAQRPKLLEFGVADETAWRVGLSCGGQISVYVQPVGESTALDASSVAALNMSRAVREPTAVVTDLTRGDVRILRGTDLAGPGADAQVLGRVRSGASGVDLAPDGQSVFISVNLPPPRLIAIGAVHISQALAPMAQLAGLDVTIVDPRTAFASAARFADVRMMTAWPQDALPKVGLDSFTAVAALTHDPKIDDDALVAALQAGCFYVGALGSRKTHAARLKRLMARGIGDDQLGRLHAPIGLAINAQSPSEIAVAILAEVIQSLRTDHTSQR